MADKLIDSGAGFDLVAVGPIFMDLIFSEILQFPEPGTECWTSSAQVLPGATANIALAAKALGLKVSLATEFGAGENSQIIKNLIAKAGIDMSYSLTLNNWDIPVTAAFEINGDRSFVTGGMEPAESVQLASEATYETANLSVSLLPHQMPLLEAARQNGVKVFADVGFDNTGIWDSGVLENLKFCDVFTPNSVEAMAYTKTDSALEAAKKLSELVPRVVVTCGNSGLVAIDARSNCLIELPAFLIEGGNPTGAGDTFLAALVAAECGGLMFEDQLRFAQLVAAGRLSGIGGANTPIVLSQLHELISTLTDDPGQLEGLIKKYNSGLAANRNDRNI